MRDLNPTPTPEKNNFFQISQVDFTSSLSTATPTITPTATKELFPTSTFTPTENSSPTVVSTATPFPTETPLPTLTPFPTETPYPTPLPTATPEVKPIQQSSREGIFYFNDVIVKGPPVNQVAITIDDGWFPEQIQATCDFCEKYKVPLTFFIVGRLFEQPEVKAALERARDLGCEFQNHTFSHLYLAKMANEGRIKELTDEIRRGQEKILEFTGGEEGNGQFLRPPFGSYNQTVVNICHSLGLEVVYWSLDTGGTRKKPDGSLPSAGEILANLKKTGRGEIPLLHTNWNDIGALERYYLEILQPRGLVPVLLSKLTPSRFVHS